MTDTTNKPESIGEYSERALNEYLSKPHPMGGNLAQKKPVASDVERVSAALEPFIDEAIIARGELPDAAKAAIAAMNKPAQVDVKELREKLIDVYRTASVTEHPASERIDKIMQVISPYLRDTKPVSGWRPIETAPRDGTEIWIAHEHYEPTLARWLNSKGGHWFVSSNPGFWPEDDPSHWMARPSSPKQEDSADV